MFDTEQREQFARNGFLVLRDAIDPVLTDEVQEIVASDDSLEPGNNDEPQAEPFRTINRQLFAYAEELVGPDRLYEPTEHIRIGLRYPDDAESIHDPRAHRREREDLGIHTDNQVYGDNMGLYVVGFATYFDDVSPRDGGFTVWPGSHVVVSEHCELEEREENSEKYNTGIREDSEFDDKEELFDLIEPFEIAGEAGTVTIWHGQLVHTGGMQLSPGSLRNAGFTRFHMKGDMDDHEEAFANPFEHWAGVPTPAEL